MQLHGNVTERMQMPAAPSWPAKRRDPNALPDALIALQTIGTRVRFARGETIFGEGDCATKTYRVLAGAVRLCKHMPDGRRQIVDFVQEGGFFGLMQLPEYVFTAEAMNDVVVASYPRPLLARLSDQLPEVRGEMLAMLNAQMLGMHAHLVMLGRQTAKERLASFLFNLAETADAANGETLDLPMSRQDIADYLGLTIETVCRELSALKKARVVAAHDLHSVIIRDFAALERIATGDE
jgi:CRP/FNR family nitrogen fixation transcriptional regulator